MGVNVVRNDQWNLKLSCCSLELISYCWLIVLMETSWVNIYVEFVQFRIWDDTHSKWKEKAAELQMLGQLTAADHHGSLFVSLRSGVFFKIPWPIKWLPTASVVLLCSTISLVFLKLRDMRRVNASGASTVGCWVGLQRRSFSFELGNRLGTRHHRRSPPLHSRTFLD